MPIARDYAYVGEIRFWANVRAMPEGWLPCDGRTLVTSQHQPLHSVIGSRYGGNSTNFRLPDLRKYAVMGAGNGPGLTPRAVGQTGGVGSVAQTTSNMPRHHHTVYFDQPSGIANPASIESATSEVPIEGGYLATGTYKKGLLTDEVKLYKQDAVPESLVSLGGLLGTATGSIDPAGKTSPTPRENRQPYMVVMGFYIANDGKLPTP